MSERLADLLTPREMDVLRLLAEGLSNKEIAATFTIETRTVERHLHAMWEKLGLRGAGNARVLAALRYWHEGNPRMLHPDEGCPGHLICNGHRVICA